MKHFYHIYADGSWETPASEHFTALTKAGFDGDIHIGIVGRPAQRDAVVSYAGTLPLPITIAAQAGEGYEQVTLDALHDWAATAPAETPVLYAHTKGSAFGTSISGDSRRAMDYCQIHHWRERVQALASGDYDAVGCHWLTPGEFPHIGPTPFFAGNYWWAQAGYLATLSPPQRNTRYDAERWVGTGNPRILDTSPPVITRWDETWNQFRYYCRTPGQD